MLDHVNSEYCLILFMHASTVWYFNLEVSRVQGDDTKWYYMILNASKCNKSFFQCNHRTKLIHIRFDNRTRMLRVLPMRLSNDLWCTDWLAAMWRLHGGPATTMPPIKSLRTNKNSRRTRTHTHTKCTQHEIKNPDLSDQTKNIDRIYRIWITVIDWFKKHNKNMYSIVFPWCCIVFFCNPLGHMGPSKDWPKQHEQKADELNTATEQREVMLLIQFSSRMHRQNIQHSPSMSLPFGWHQSNQGNAGSAYLENVMTGADQMWWRRKNGVRKKLTTWHNLYQTYEYFKVLHVFSCSFRMFHAGSTSFPGHSLGEICELCSSTTQHSAPHETTCRAVGGTGIRHTMKCQNMTPVKGIIHHDDTCWYCIDG